MNDHTLSRECAHCQYGVKAVGTKNSNTHVVQICNRDGDDCWFVTLCGREIKQKKTNKLIKTSHYGSITCPQCIEIWTRFKGEPPK